jgi:hypothetical protein
MGKLNDTYFDGDFNNKPKLIESKLIKRIVNEQTNNSEFEERAKVILIDFIKKNYVVLIGIGICIGLLYWRYIEIQHRRKKNKSYDSDSDDE